MFRITVIQGSKPPKLKLEGRLAGPWVDELGRVWSEVREREPEALPTVDLSGVTCVSAKGKGLLKSLFQQGADFKSGSLMMRFIVGQFKTAVKGKHVNVSGQIPT